MIAAEGPAKIKRIAVIGGPDDKVIKWPPERSESSVKEIEEVCHACGHCLQIIWENCFNDPAVELITLLQTGEIAITEIGHAFPMRFGPKELGASYNK
jgi:cytidine deaminase